MYRVAQKSLDTRLLRFKERSVKGIFFIHHSALKGQNKSGDSQYNLCTSVQY